MDKKIIAWHGEPELKKSVIEMMKVHRELDELLTGQYWPDGS
jgi:MoaA/NifB/PqqE/SkfB family radical SAM enzyme